MGTDETTKFRELEGPTIHHDQLQDLGMGLLLPRQQARRQHGRCNQADRAKTELGQERWQGGGQGGRRGRTRVRRVSPSRKPSRNSPLGGRDARLGGFGDGYGGAGAGGYDPRAVRGMVVPKLQDQRGRGAPPSQAGRAAGSGAYGRDFGRG